MEKRYTCLLPLSLIFLMTVINAAAQKKTVPPPKTIPHLVFKMPYVNTRILAKTKELQKNGNLGKKFPSGKISPEVFKNARSASDFLSVFRTRNSAVGPMFLNAPYYTYLRLGPYNESLPLIKDQVVSALYGETDRSFLVSDKDFTPRSRINSQLPRDLLAAWQLEAGAKGSYKISSGSSKKYLGVASDNVSGAQQITFTSDRSTTATDWSVYIGPDDGITLYNAAFNVFLGRKVIGRKVFLIPLSYKDYGNEPLRKAVPISWDLYQQYDQMDARTYCGEVKHTHSMRYAATRPVRDYDGDGAVSVQCGGTDCDDTDASRYPSATEECDANGRDEDCNMNTFGQVDADRDGYFASTCFNVDATGTVVAGDDCDDNNPAIYPGQQKYISENMVEVCNIGTYAVEQGFMAVRQPNGTAIVVPKR